MKQSLFALVAVVTVGCSGTAYPPAGPSSVVPPASTTLNLSGRWDGSWSATLDGERFVSTITLRLDHAGDTAHGTWRLITGRFGVGSDFGGDVSLAIQSDTLSGLVTWELPDSDGRTCHGTMAIAGRVSPEQITASAPGVALRDCARRVTDVQWTLAPSYMVAAP